MVDVNAPVTVFSSLDVTNLPPKCARGITFMKRRRHFAQRPSQLEFSNSPFTERDRYLTPDPTAFGGHKQYKEEFPGGPRIHGRKHFDNEKNAYQDDEMGKYIMNRGAKGVLYGTNNDGERRRGTKHFPYYHNQKTDRVISHEQPTQINDLLRRNWRSEKYNSNCKNEEFLDPKSSFETSKRIVSFDVRPQGNTHGTRFGQDNNQNGMAFDALMKNARAQVGKGRFDRSPAGAASGGQTARGRHSYWYERAAKANKGNLSAR